MIKLILITVSLVFAKVQGEKLNRADLKKKLFEGCMAKIEGVADKKQAICRCVTENLDKGSNIYQLKIHAANYASTAPVDENKVTDATALDNFDYDVSTSCIADPKWTYNPNSTKPQGE